MNTNHAGFRNGYTGLALKSSSGWWCELFRYGRFVATTPANNKSEVAALAAGRLLIATASKKNGTK